MIIFNLFSILSLFALFYRQAEMRIAFVKAMIINAFFSVVMLETFSFFNMVKRLPISIFWVMICIVLVALAFKKGKFKSVFVDFSEQIHQLKLDKSNYFFYLIVSLFLASLFLIALLFPPNNWDSMTYHLSRVMHWIQNGNLNFYQTNNIRQLFTPCLSEYLILNTYLLSGCDCFANLIQYFSMISSLLLVTLISERLANKTSKRKSVFVSILLLVIIPMGILQATTTQTDYLASFFSLAIVYFGYVPIIEKQLKLKHIILFSICLSLGWFAKPTSYLFVFPFCVGIAVVWIIKYKFQLIKAIPLVILFFIVINGQLIYRNYSSFDNVFGNVTNKQEILNFGNMISTAAKNISMHLALPFPLWNKMVENGITIMHQIINVPVDNANVNYLNTKYGIWYRIDEDAAGNLIHLLLFIAGVVVLFKLLKKFANKILLIFYLVALVTGYLLFSLVFKWQPWQSRLDLPFFLLAIPFISIVLSDGKYYRILFFIEKIMSFLMKYKRLFLISFTTISFITFLLLQQPSVRNIIIVRIGEITGIEIHQGYFFSLDSKLLFLSYSILFISSLFILGLVFSKKLLFLSNLRNILIIVLSVSALPYLIFNPLKPIEKLGVSRNEKYFVGRVDLKTGYFNAVQVIQTNQYKKIGLSFGGDSWEYPLWALIKNKDEKQMEYFGANYYNSGFEYSDAEVIVGDIPPNNDSFDILYDWGYLKMWSGKMERPALPVGDH